MPAAPPRPVCLRIPGSVGGIPNRDVLRRCAPCAVPLNPNVVYAGSLTGTAAQDNARALNNNAATVANFRPSSTATQTCTYTITPDIDVVHRKRRHGHCRRDDGGPVAGGRRRPTQAGWELGRGGSGAGSVLVFVASNTGSPRSTTATIAGSAVSISEAGVAPPCTYTVTPRSLTFDASGGSATVTVIDRRRMFVGDSELRGVGHRDIGHDRAGIGDRDAPSATRATRETPPECRWSDRDGDSRPRRWYPVVQLQLYSVTPARPDRASRWRTPAGPGINRRELRMDCEEQHRLVEGYGGGTAPAPRRCKWALRPVNRERRPPRRRTDGYGDAAGWRAK